MRGGTAAAEAAGTATAATTVAAEAMAVVETESGYTRTHQLPLHARPSCMIRTTWRSKTVSMQRPLLPEDMAAVAHAQCSCNKWRLHQRTKHLLSYCAFFMGKVPLHLQRLQCQGPDSFSFERNLRSHSPLQSRAFRCCLTQSNWTAAQNTLGLDIKRAPEMQCQTSPPSDRMCWKAAYGASGPGLTESSV